MSARVTHPKCAVILEPIVAPLGSTATTEQRRLTMRPVVPISAQVTRNPTDQADVATVEVEFDIMPLDPRYIRDIRMTIYADALTDQTQGLDISRRTARFVGFVDFPEQSFGARGNTVRLQARDYRGRLLDTPLAFTSVDITGTLSDVIYRVMSPIPGYGRPGPGVQGISVSVQDDTPPRVALGKASWTPPKGCTTWDAIVQIAHLTGQSAWFDLDRLVVGLPRTAENGAQFSVAFGETVEEFSQRRNMNPQARKAVLVTATNPRTRQQTSGRWPVKARDGESVQGIAVTGAYTAAQCQASARRIYEQAERAQIEATVRTQDARDRDAHPLLGMVSGDRVYAHFRAVDTTHVLGKSADQIAAFMIDSGMDANTAHDLASRYVQAKEFRPLFYVRRVDWTWARDRGFQFSLDLQNVLDLGLQG